MSPEKLSYSHDGAKVAHAASLASLQARMRAPPVTVGENRNKTTDPYQVDSHSL